MGKLLVKTLVIIMFFAILACSVQSAQSLTVYLWVNNSTFNPLIEPVTISYSTDVAVSVAAINITDNNGNVAWIYEANRTAGTHQVQWNGFGNYGSYNNRVVPNGQYTIYFTAIIMPPPSMLGNSTTKIGWTYVTVNVPETTPTPTPTPTPSGPKADFFADPLTGEKPLTVHFYDRSTGTSLTYTWNFGDSTSSEQNPVHVYQNAGTYEVSLRVTNAFGTDQKIMPKYITVTEPAQNDGGGGQQNNGDGQGTQVPLVLYAWATPSTVDKDRDTIITVEVMDQNNTSVQDAKVNFTVPEGVTLIPTAGITNESGICQFSFKSSSYGNYTLNATASKQGYASGYNQTLVVVSGNDLSCLLTILPFAFIIALIALLALAAVYLLLRRTSVRLEPRKTIVTADGKATIPVSVSLVNGLGRLKKAKKSTEVAMGTTAGTISDIIIPAGSSSAEAILTSSREFGPVVISANYGNKTASANVDFKYNQAALDVTAMPPEMPADGTSTSTITVKVKNEAGDYIAPLEEKIVELHTTLGRVQSPVRLLPKSQSLSAVLTAGETGGEAVVTALMGSVKGETRVTLKGAPKRFCMHCGATMTMEASQCPKCGLTPPSGVDVKQCTTCSTVIPEAAKYCDKCGARQPEKAVQEKVPGQPGQPGKDDA
jgi:PKD repeat protein/ribosomal protein L40E